MDLKNLFGDRLWTKYPSGHSPSIAEKTCDSPHVATQYLARTGLGLVRLDSRGEISSEDDLNPNSLYHQWSSPGASQESILQDEIMADTTMGNQLGLFELFANTAKWNLSKQATLNFARYNTGHCPVSKSETKLASMFDKKNNNFGGPLNKMFNIQCQNLAGNTAEGSPKQDSFAQPFPSIPKNGKVKEDTKTMESERDIRVSQVGAILAQMNLCCRDTSKTLENKSRDTKENKSRDTKKPMSENNTQMAQEETGSKTTAHKNTPVECAKHCVQFTCICHQSKPLPNVDLCKTENEVECGSHSTSQNSSIFHVSIACATPQQTADKDELNLCGKSQEKSRKKKLRPSAKKRRRLKRQQEAGISPMKRSLGNDPSNVKKKFKSETETEQTQNQDNNNPSKTCFEGVAFIVENDEDSCEKKTEKSSKVAFFIGGFGDGDSDSDEDEDDSNATDTSEENINYDELWDSFHYKDPYHPLNVQIQCSTKPVHKSVSSPELGSSPEGPIDFIWNLQINFPKPRNGKKQVHFPSDEELAVVHEVILLTDEDCEARRGPWEEMALDRCRFEKRIQDTEESIGYCFLPAHRAWILQRLKANQYRHLSI